MRIATRGARPSRARLGKLLDGVGLGLEAGVGEVDRHAKQPAPERGLDVLPRRPARALELDHQIVRAGER
ncbi:MAG: hypothetical protein ACR2OB_00415 [Solirubrobacteraceae bacterium]